MKHKIIKKAWRVTHFNIDYPGYEIIHAHTREEARFQLQKINTDYKYSENSAKREPDHDIIEIDGLKGEKRYVLPKFKERNRYQKIKDLPDYGERYVIKNGYVGNALLCWGHDRNGYTCIWENIGQYTKTDLLEIFEKGIREQDVIIPVADILPGLKTIVESQYITYSNKI